MIFHDHSKSPVESIWKNTSKMPILPNFSINLGPRELLKMRALASATDRHGARRSGVSRGGMKMMKANETHVKHSCSR